MLQTQSEYSIWDDLYPGLSSVPVELVTSEPHSGNKKKNQSDDTDTSTSVLELRD